MDEKKRWNKLHQAAKLLLEAGYTPNQVQDAYDALIEGVIDDAFEDPVLDVLDCFTDWCPNPELNLDKYHKNLYDPNFGDHKTCECGHEYYRHYDTYEDMEHVGCKYCPCFYFKGK